MRIARRQSVHEKTTLLTNAVQTTHSYTFLQLGFSHPYQSKAISV